MDYEKYKSYKTAKRYRTADKVKSFLDADTGSQAQKKAKALVAKLTSIEPQAQTIQLISGSTANSKPARLIPDSQVNPQPARLIPDSQVDPQSAQNTAKPKTSGAQKADGANVSETGNALVDTAMQYLGTPYVWGGTSPDGFDCSGFTQYSYKQNGISIPRTAREQFKAGNAVSKDNLQPGDLVFFKGYTKSAENPGHVGMYIGNGQYIQAPKTGDVIKISKLSGRSDYVGARRY